jgi:hypothetical protein
MPVQPRRYTDASNAINDGINLSDTLAASAGEKPIHREFGTATI